MLYIDVNNFYIFIVNNLKIFLLKNKINKIIILI